MRPTHSWNTRVQLDPMLWMAEAFSDPAEFWASGERDFALLVQTLIPPLPQQARVLELGCGVGRLIGPALSRGCSAVGIDGSEAALTFATKRYAGFPSVRFIKSELPAIPAGLGKFDLVLSFATLPHLAPEALVETLIQIPLLLTARGCATLQLYVGDEHTFTASDDFSLRSYNLERLRQAFAFAALEIRSERKLELPFSTNDNVLNRAPFIFDLFPAAHKQESPQIILDALISQRPSSHSRETSIDAYRVLVTKMNQLIAEKDFAAVTKYLAFARDAHPDNEDEWQRLSEVLERLA